MNAFGIFSTLNFLIKTPVSFPMLYLPSKLSQNLCLIYHAQLLEIIPKLYFSNESARNIWQSDFVKKEGIKETGLLYL